MKEDSIEILWMEEHDCLSFAQEEQNEMQEGLNRWKLMIVDDEQEVHTVTKMVLSDFRYDGKFLEFISAYSAKEAKALIERYPDTAVILLDVVMEEDDAGLKFVKYIREELKNKLVRIILRTGQPGQAPEEKVILCYDINDYKEKTELTSKRLFTAMVAALRSYRDITVIDTSRKGLEAVIRSSTGMLKMQSMKEFTSGVLSQFKEVIDNLKEAIVVVNSLNKIITFNNSFINTFFKDEELKNLDNIGIFVRVLKYGAIKDDNRIIHAIEHGSDTHINGELIFDGDNKKYLSVNIQPVFDKKHEMLGRVISFNDITDYKILLEKLKEHAITVEELAVARERNRIAIDMHDTLGHTITLLIALLEVIAITCRNDPCKSEEKISVAIGAAREGLRELRRSISGLMPQKLEENNLVSALENLIEEFKTSGMDVDFLADEMSDYLNPVYSDVIYKICQEALTNSLRHGKAKNVSIILRYVEGLIKLYVFDDGVGCKVINKGYGLYGMEHRVQELKGKIAYGSGDESGFNIHVEIPISRRVCY